MKKKLELMIIHIIENSCGDCNCPLCFKQENHTYLDGLKEALKLIPKRRK